MKINENLNPSQQQAVQTTEGPLIIFAGAGTGKTRVITHRIANLLNNNVSPHSILAVTFTNKAAQEMKTRVNDLVGGLGANVWISTFHSFGASFLRVEAKKINLNPDFLIYDYADQKNVIKDCLKELNFDEKKYKPSTVIDRISRAKDDLKSPADMAIDADNNGDFIMANMAKIYEKYQKKLESAGALDFGDLIMQTVVALQQYPALLEHYQERFKYVMVDEYQDTNHAQYMLTKLLVAKHQNICVVGDDDQSVYSWRGADINNILDFKNDYPNAKEVKLEQNYRSTPKILEYAYKVVKHNNDRVEKKLWTKNNDDGVVNVIQAENETDEASNVANLITVLKKKENCTLSNFAVFYRTNAQSRVFEDVFRREGIPYTIIGTLKFYDRAEIKDIMAYLKLIHNQNDNVSFKRIINVPKRGIGKTSIENLEKESFKRNLSIWQTIPFAKDAGLTKTTIEALEKFCVFINSLANLKRTQSVKEIAQSVITHSGYLKELEAENTVEAKSKIENIEELISAIDDFEKRSNEDKSLSGYLTQIALINDTDLIEQSTDNVTLMTLHLAKGLEFNNVFICGLEEGLFPIGESAFNPVELEEERRLMYVGMTRARKNLYLCWAKERTIYGKTRWNMASRFLSEAGFKQEFSQKPQNNFVSNNYNRTSWHKKDNYSSKAKYTYKNDDTYDYMPTDDEIIKDEPLYTPTQDNSPYKIGTLVQHPVFGNGKIIEKSGIGADLKLVVLFENGQWKKLLAKVANLTIKT